MKNSLLFTLLISIAVATISCEDDKQERICETTCDNETVIGKVENTFGEINFHRMNRSIDPEPVGYWIINISTDSIKYNGPSDNADEIILVPCNLNDSYKKDSLKVIVSGRRLSCCGLLTKPYFRTSWGCKFEITSITTLTD